tara:strand:+ start:6580 stop:6786 length:207 start_codon:yes stop_codon:yes gene_type:complete
VCTFLAEEPESVHTEDISVVDKKDHVDVVWFVTENPEVKSATPPALVDVREAASALDEAPYAYNPVIQ